MKCYYHYLSKRRGVLQSIVISDHPDPLIVIDIDQDGNSMGIEYCD